MIQYNGQKGKAPGLVHELYRLSDSFSEYYNENTAINSGSGSPGPFPDIFHFSDTAIRPAIERNTVSQ